MQKACPKETRTAAILMAAVLGVMSFGAEAHNVEPVCQLPASQLTDQQAEYCYEKEHEQQYCETDAECEQLHAHDPFSDSWNGLTDFPIANNH